MILPFVSFLLIMVFVKRRWAAFLWREAILAAYLACGLLVLASTEFLSLFRCFSFFPLCVFWTLVLMAALLLNVYGAKGRRLHLPALDKPTAADKAILVITACLALGTLGIALIVPPNTWDGMTYHMGRVVHWIQNHGNMFYPTNIDRQLYINPFPEYCVAQFQMLSHGDRFANFVQWLCYAGSLVGISLIALRIGLDRRGQILASFFVATLPNAITQSTSTQTDYSAALWSLIAVSFILTNIQAATVPSTCVAAGAIVLAFYAKGSTLFICVPFLMWMTWRLLPGRGGGHRRWSKALVHAGIPVGCFVLVVGALLLKNYLILGSAVYPQEKAAVLSVTNIRGIVSNLILNYGMHLRTGFPGIDNGTEGVVEQLHRMLGMTILTSPANILRLPFNYQDFPFYEDEVPNFVFFLISLGGAAHFLLFRRREWNTLKGSYFFAVSVCFFLFNAFVVWSPFAARYHLPFFVLWAPFLADVFCRRRAALAAAVALFTLFAVPHVILNPSKPIVVGPLKLPNGLTYTGPGPSILTTPREFQYFYNSPGRTAPIITAAQGVLRSGCRQVGVELGEDDWEYPFWALLAKDPSPFRLEHVFVQNQSKHLPYPLGDFAPCVIISARQISSMSLAGQTYYPMENAKGYLLYYSAGFIQQHSSAR